MKTPWSHLTRALTDDEWSELKAWRQANAGLAFRIGDERPDGLVFGGWIRDCRAGEWWITKERLAKHKAKVVECQNRRRLVDGEAVTKERNRTWRKKHFSANPEKAASVAVYQKQYMANPCVRARLRARRRERYSTDASFRDYQKRYTLAWIRSNRGALNASLKARKALLRSRVHPDNNAQTCRLFYKEAARLTAETGIQHHVDHIIPLHVGGWHHHLNLQVIPYFVNCSKKHAATWMNRTFRDWRDVPQFLWPVNLAPIFYRLLDFEPLRKK